MGEMADTDSWQRMVLLALPPPGWLEADAPAEDVVLSSRVRFARNLRGFRFVTTAPDGELRQIQDEIIAASKALPQELTVYKGLTNAERDYLVGARLVSADFEWTLPGRAVLIDRDRQLSLMINEEDHLRIQALTPGLSVSDATELARRCLSGLSQQLEFAVHPQFGNLTASPSNLGPACRFSAMFHLIGLAQAKRLPTVIEALGAQGITVRGLFGEASRAIGAFAQVSVLDGDAAAFAGACEYLLSEERRYRQELGTNSLRESAEQAREFLLRSPTLSLANALRVLAWMRWAASESMQGFPKNPRTVDAALTTLELRGIGREELAGRQRAEHLRAALES